MRMPTRPLVVLEDLLDVAGLVAAAGVDAVEPLGVAAGVVVDLQLVVAADLELVRHLAGLRRRPAIAFSASRCLCRAARSSGPRG